MCRKEIGMYVVKEKVNTLLYMYVLYVHMYVCLYVCKQK